VSPDDIERDDLVARALGSLPVPEHQPDFWERVDGAFETIDHDGGREQTQIRAPGAPGSTEIHDLDAARHSHHRRARFGRRYQMLSAAAAVAVVIAGVGVLNNSSGNGKDDAPLAAAQPRRTDIPLTDPEPPATTSAPVKAVQAWSKAIDEGNADKAWALMGSDSQAYLTAQGGWEQMVAEMSEGSHAAWSRTPGVLWDSLDLDPAAVVVTVSGTLLLEGTQEYRTTAYPTVETDGGWKVEAFAFGPGDTDADFLTPAPGENGLGGVGPDVVIEVHVIPNNEVWVSIDGGPLTPMVKRGEKIWAYDPPGDLASRTHGIVVVTRTHRTVNPSDGSWFTASAGQFAVEG
jgi:hypothetical protein